MKYQNFKEKNRKNRNLNFTNENMNKLLKKTYLFLYLSDYIYMSIKFTLKPHLFSGICLPFKKH